MHSVQLVLALLVILVALVALALRLNISYPIVLVLGGLVLALAPRMPSVRLEPDIVFLVFLPPLLFSDALNSSWRDFRENWRPILFLSVGLVFATTGSVLLIAHFLLGLDWGPAFVLGAVLGPTDTVAVSAILERFAIPHRLSAILRGESLVNDASALVLFEAAIHTTQLRKYVWGSVLSEFSLAVAGGVIIGAVVGWLAVQLRRHTREPLLHNTISLLAAFGAYQPAAAIHVSGVLAVVTAGLYLGWNDPRIGTPQSRLQAAGSWEMLTFLLNGLLFILIGLQLRTVGEPLWSQNPWSLIWGGIAISATVIGARIVWVFSSTSLGASFSRLRWPTGVAADRSQATSGKTSASSVESLSSSSSNPAARSDGVPEYRSSVPSPKSAPQSPDRDQSKRQAILLSWVGIRGGISLAAALAIPPTLGNGSPFPQRAQVIIFTFAVILVTLVAQGLTLPQLLRWLQFTAEPGSKAEEIKARSAMAAAAITYLQSLPGSDQAETPAVAHLLDTYSQPVQRPPATEATPPDHSQTGDSGRVVSMELAIIKEQRARLIELRDKAEISDEVLRRFQSILDLKESQLDQSRGSWEM